jgi:hypothetical protein
MRSTWRTAFMGGFECASQRLISGARLDLAVSTGHLATADADYARMAEHDLWIARDGFRWHAIERSPGRYDWSSARRLLQAADAAGLEVIWDLCHYGFPDDLDLRSAGFVERFAAFATAAAVLVRNESPMAPRYCPINEISFWAWAGGERAVLNPFWAGEGDALKRQLVRAALAAIEGIRSVDPRAEIFTAEPLIRVAAAELSTAAIAAAQSYHEAQYHALEMLLGRQAPELGGHADAVDVIGVNFYPDNQWVLGGGTIPFGHHDYRPLSHLLLECSRRFERPLIIAETGAEGGARAAWLHYVSTEARAATTAGCDLLGVCLYPVTDYPGWVNDRHCPVGLFSPPDAGGQRIVDQPLCDELRRQQGIWERERPHARSQSRGSTAEMAARL